MKPLWPHQERAVADLPDRLEPGSRGCVTSPTGSGKSRVMRELIRKFGSVSLYTNRRMLLEQLSEDLRQDGIDHGVLARGYAPEWECDVQLCSVQTITSRAIKKTKWDVPPSRLVIVDEAHVNSAGSVQKIAEMHLDKGAALLGFTATPLDIGHMYDWLYTMAVTSECRAVGALVPAIHYAPDEPDTHNLKRTKTGEFTEPDVKKAIMSATILGRVIDHYWRINADQRPTVLFAPGVAESLWFCDELNKNGIPAAHIDGERVSLDGQHYVSNKNARDEIRERLRSGDIKVVCNRYVLREGIDWPFVGHMIFATIFGSLCSYLQSGGRGLRAAPGKENVTVQDHGGSWHRLGSLNADRDWVLGDTAYMQAELREQRMKQKEEAEPITCAKCHAVRMMGKGCPVCGHISDGKRRMVVQKDGTLKAQHGDIYRMPVRDRSPREVCEQRWESCYHSCRRKGETFREAYGRYHYRYGWVAPPEGLPLMPRHERDWFMRIQDVPQERLIPKADRLFVGGGA